MVAWIHPHHLTPLWDYISAPSMYNECSLLLQIQCCAPVLIHLAMALSQWAPLLWEVTHTTAVTLDIDYLYLYTQAELVNYQESGMEHSQHALVSNKKTNCIIVTLNFIYIGTCSYLSSPSYGRVSVTTDDIGGRANYTCNSGFRLVGLSTRTCLSDGTWSGSEPICNCKSSIYIIYITAVSHPS